MNIIPLSNTLLPLPQRDRSSHKGNFGHVLVIGGDHSMGGAAILAGLFAIRTGAGKVTIATRPEHIIAILAKEPCLMAKGINSNQDLLPLIQQATTLVIGPGLGRSGWSQTLFNFSITQPQNKIIDADALFWLKQYPDKLDDHAIFTPHLKEAAMLLDTTVKIIQMDRLSAVKALQERYGGIAILKGAGTLIYTGNKIYQCHQGNPGMASGGMGDALSGILGGLIAQHIIPELSAQIGVLAHALAGDSAAKERGEIGLIATDLLNPLSMILNVG